MEITNKRVNITLSKEDIELIEKMRKFTDEYHEQNDDCRKLSCVSCPLNIFCSDTIDTFVGTIERHLNNEL